MSMARTRWAVTTALVAAICIAGQLAAPFLTRTRASSPDQGSAPSGAQKARTPTSYTFRDEVSLVVLQVTVTDANGRPLSNLGHRDFSLRVGDRTSPIDFFSRPGHEPLVLLLLVDTSGSMEELSKIDLARKAVRNLLLSLRPGDRAAMLTFSDGIQQKQADFTENFQTLRQRLDDVTPRGQTALNDAIVQVPKLLPSSVLAGPGAVFLISDGLDNRSELDLDATLARLRTYPVPVYAVGFRRFPASLEMELGRNTNYELLRRLAEATGGRVYPVYDLADTQDAVSEIRREIRSQYLIGFEDPGGDPSIPLKVELECLRPDTTVRTRTWHYPIP